MATFERFLEPPRLRTLDDDEPERRATWLELFFDLVFVAAVAQLGQALAADPSVRGIAEFAALFVAVWWAWMGFTFYADRFDTDDLVYRALTLAGMFAVAAVAVNVRHAFDDWTPFVVSYVLVRVVLLVLYVRARRHVAQARRLTEIYLVLFSAGVALWLLTLALDPPMRYVVWGLALAIEVSAPTLGWRVVREAPVHRSHIPERFGLFAIIVLGEAVLAVVLGTSKTTWSVAPSAVAVAAFLTAAAIWWVHFDFGDSSVLGRGLGGLFYVYGHYPLVLGIAALGVGTKLAIVETPHGALHQATRWIYCGGVALALAAMGTVQLAGTRSLRDKDLWLRIGSAGAIAVVAALIDAPVLLTWLVAAVLVGQVLLELVGHDRHHAM